MRGSKPRPSRLVETHSMNEHALFNPIRRRLVGWAVLVLGLIMVLLGTSVYLTLSGSLVDQVDRNLMARSDQAFSPAGGPGHSEGHDGYSGGTFYVAIGADGQVTELVDVGEALRGIYRDRGRPDTR